MSNPIERMAMEVVRESHELANRGKEEPLYTRFNPFSGKRLSTWVSSEEIHKMRPMFEPYVVVVAEPDYFMTREAALESVREVLANAVRLYRDDPEAKVLWDADLLAKVELMLAE